MTKFRDFYRAAYRKAIDTRLRAPDVGNISKPRLTVFGVCFACFGLFLFVLPTLSPGDSPIGIRVAGGLILVFGLAMVGYRNEMVLRSEGWELTTGFLPFAKRLKGEYSSISYIDFGREVIYSGKFRNTPKTCFSTWFCVAEKNAPPIRFELMNAPEEVFSEVEAREYVDRLATRLNVKVKVREGIRDVKHGLNLEFENS